MISATPTNGCFFCARNRRSLLFKTVDQRHHPPAMLWALIQFAADLIRALLIDELSHRVRLKVGEVWQSSKIAGKGPFACDSPSGCSILMDRISHALDRVGACIHSGCPGCKTSLRQMRCGNAIREFLAKWSRFDTSTDRPCGTVVFGV